ncbi:MAG: hypothetical protein ACPGVC_09455 [Salibacteraceae bacterium]
MNNLKSLFTVTLILTTCLGAFAQRLQVNNTPSIDPTPMEFDHIMANDGEHCFTTKITDGVLITEGFETPGRKMLEATSTRLIKESSGVEIPITETVNTQAGLVLIGELKTNFGTDYYFGITKPGRETKVMGTYFHSINLVKKQSVHQLKLVVSERADRVALSYLLKNPKSEMWEAKMVFLGIGGEQSTTINYSFAMLKEAELSEAFMYEVYIGQHNGFFVVANIPRDDSKEPEIITVLTQVGQDGKPKFEFEVAKGREEVITNCMIKRSENGSSIILAGIPRFLEKVKTSNGVVYFCELNIKEGKRINEGFVDLDVSSMEVIGGDVFNSGNKEAQINLSHNFKLVDLYATVDKNYVFVAENLAVNEDEMVVNDELLIIRINEDRLLDWMVGIPNNCNAQEKDLEKIKEIKNNLEWWSTRSVFNDGQVHLLLKKPNLSGSEIIIKETYKYLPISISITSKSGEISSFQGVEFLGDNPNMVYIRKYLEAKTR